MSQFCVYEKLAKTYHLQELLSYRLWFVVFRTDHQGTISRCTNPYDGLSNGEKTCETNDRQVVTMTQINFPKNRAGVGVIADACQAQQSGDDRKEQEGNDLNLEKYPFSSQSNFYSGLHKEET